MAYQGRKCARFRLEVSLVTCVLGVWVAGTFSLLAYHAGAAGAAYAWPASAAAAAASHADHTQDSLYTAYDEDIEYAAQAVRASRGNGISSEDPNGVSLLQGRSLLHRGCHRRRCIPRCPRCSFKRRHCRRRRRIFNCIARPGIGGVAPAILDPPTSLPPSPTEPNPPGASHALPGSQGTGVLAGSAPAPTGSPPEGPRAAFQLFNPVEAPSDAELQQPAGLYEYENPFGYVYGEAVGYIPDTYYDDPDGPAGAAGESAGASDMQDPTMGPDATGYDFREEYLGPHGQMYEPVGGSPAAGQGQTEFIVYI
eukprot:jgi/Ulvmu1/3968/UM181_0002.1